MAGVPREMRRLGVQEKVIQQLVAARARLEAKYTKSRLDPRDEYEVGVLVGKLAALRWVLGYGWDED